MGSFDPVAALAVLADLLPVACLVVVVVTAEASRKVNVADVVRIGAELHAHFRKHISAIEGDGCRHPLLDIVAVRGIVGLILRSIEIAQAQRNAQDGKMILREAMRKHVPDRVIAHPKRGFSAPDATRKSAIEDVMWALLDSAEFVFNH